VSVRRISSVRSDRPSSTVHKSTNTHHARGIAPSISFTSRLWNATSWGHPQLSAVLFHRLAQLLCRQSTTSSSLFDTIVIFRYQHFDQAAHRVTYLQLIHQLHLLRNRTRGCIGVREAPPPIPLIQSSARTAEHNPDRQTRVLVPLLPPYLPKAEPLGNEVREVHPLGRARVYLYPQ
jgi:hypothetical protein